MPPTSEDRRKCLCFYIHTLFGIRRCGGIRLSSNECVWVVVVVVVVRNEIADWQEGLLSFETDSGSAAQPSDS